MLAQCETGCAVIVHDADGVFERCCSCILTSLPTYRGLSSPTLKQRRATNIKSVHLLIDLTFDFRERGPNNTTFRISILADSNPGLVPMILISLGLLRNLALKTLGFPQQTISLDALNKADIKPTNRA